MTILEAILDDMLRDREFKIWLKPTAFLSQQVTQACSNVVRKVPVVRNVLNICAIAGLVWVQSLVKGVKGMRYTGDYCFQSVQKNNKGCTV